MRTILLSTLLVAGPAASPETPDDRAADVNVAAFLDAASLEVGGSYELEVFVDLPGGTERSPCFLQIDAPPSVKLVGDEPTTHRELARNDLVQEPWERLLKELPARVAFELVAEPAADETIGLNLIAYVRPEGEEPFFLRRRLELPVEAGVDAVEADAKVSSWGKDPALARIGSKAPDFVLPRGDGTEVRLGELLGKGNVIVTTYRAHW